MKNRKYFAMLALLGALSLIAAACSDDGGTTTGGSGATSATGGAVDCASDEFGCVEIAAGDPIQLASLLSITGDTAFLGTDSNNGILLALDYLDDKFDGTPGQLLGHDVTLQQEDDGCSAEGGQAGATALAANPDIVAVIGTSCSSAALGVADTILGDKGMILISPSNTNPGLTSEEAHQPFYLRTAHNDKIQGAIVADFVFTKLGIDTAATINDESPYADGLAAAFRDNFEALGGTITDTEQVNSGDTDLGPVFTNIAADQPRCRLRTELQPGLRPELHAGLGHPGEGNHPDRLGRLPREFVPGHGRRSDQGLRLLRVVAGRDRVPGWGLLQERVPPRLHGPVRRADVGVQRPRLRRIEHPVRRDRGHGGRTTAAGT